MHVINKFGPFDPGSNPVIECRRVVHFGPQGNGQLFVWAECGEHTNRKLKFSIVGTGHPFDSHYQHKFTCVTNGGFVWHLLQYMIPGVR